MTDRFGLVVRKDVRDSFRERQLHYLGVIFLVFGLGGGYLLGRSGLDGSAVGSALLTLFLFLGPATALSISHDSVAGKWGAGELTVLLGLPFSRFDVVYGSVLGRTAVVGGLALVALTVAAGVASVFGTVPAVGVLVVGGAAVLVLVLVFVSLAVAVSSLSSSTTVSSTGAFGVFVLFVFRIWEFMPGIVNFALDSIGAGTIPPEFARLWANLTPYAAVRNVVVAVVAPAGDAFFAYAGGSVPGTTPGYQHPLVAALVVVFWATVPLTLGYLRFRNADL